MAPERGTLRIYLGAAPGVGKTFAMLGEGQRRHDRGTDVVVGFVEDHGRPRTKAMIEGLEVIPRRVVTYRGATFTEMDVDAILERRPQVALVDELAHTNVPGSRNAKRWQDVEELLAAGITVLSTVNIQHLESLNDVVEKITGIKQRETLPDSVVRGADQVELVDIAPEALRRRMAHGNVYAPDKINAAMSNYFRVGNLTALRELALLWLADKVEEGLKHYRAEHHIEEVWETRERVVVALTGGPEGDTLIRRAARIASRGGADLLAVHVVHSDGLTGANPAMLARQRALVESLGGSYHQVVDEDIPKALIEFARAENATQLVLGASRRSRLATFLSGPGIGASTVRLSGDIDVHMVTHEEMGRGGRLPALTGGLTLRRRLLGAALALVVLPLLTLVLADLRSTVTLSSDLLTFLLVVIVVALVGGLYPALPAAVAASALLNYYFTPPLHQFVITEGNHLLALLAFLAVAALTSSVVDLAARRTRQAARASAESATLATLAGSVLRGESALPALLERLRETFSMNCVTLLERGGDGWTVLAHSGSPPCASPEEGDVEMPVGDRLALVLRGRQLPAQDRRILGAFAAQAAVALEQQRLAAAVAAAKPLAEAERTRTALLTAVSHDLRTPLAAARAAVGSLRGGEVHSPEDQAELLATAEESLERLNRLVDNLLDMSRLQAGALSVRLEPVGLEDVVPDALEELGPASLRVALDLPESLPEVLADPALLERVVANLTANALRYSPPERPPRLSASLLGGQVELRVVDFGPGIPEADWEKVFTPFQRLGDTDNSTGVGLGLALARGLTEAMGGTLKPEETPGGGLTMVLSLPAIGVPVSTGPVVAPAEVDL